MISKEKILNVLKSKNVDLNKIANNSEKFDRACHIVYKSIPIPWRWVVGKKRISRYIVKALDANTNKK
jgi:hypothetical protein